MGKSVNKEIKDVRTKDGNLRFGHIHKDQTKSSIMLQGQGGLEFITIDQTDPRAGWIWSRCRGRYQIIAGDNIKEDDVAIYISSAGGNGLAQGNIEILTKGTFKVNAENIQLIARGNDNRNGYINLDADEEIKLKAKRINIDATETCSIFSSGELNTTAENIMKMTAGSFQKLSAASALKRPGFPVNRRGLSIVKPSNK
jgi:hypothetical protein